MKLIAFQDLDMTFKLNIRPILVALFWLTLFTLLIMVREYSRTHAIQVGNVIYFNTEDSVVTNFYPTK